MEECKCKPAKTYAERIIEYREFASLVKRMREVQEAFFNAVSAKDMDEMYQCRKVAIALEREVDEYLKKINT